MRRVKVTCDGGCGIELTLELNPGKAEGGFYACDIEYELEERGWVMKEHKDYCDECASAQRT